MAARKIVVVAFFVVFVATLFAAPSITSSAYGVSYIGAPYYPGYGPPYYPGYGPPYYPGYGPPYYHGSGPPYYPGYGPPYYSGYGPPYHQVLGPVYYQGYRCSAENSTTFY
jgi:hypothetical protein